MAVTADQVVVRLEAQTSKYQQNILRAERTSTSAFNRMQTGAKRASAGINASLRGAAAGLATVQLVRGSIQLADAATQIGNSLRVAGLEGEELIQVYDRLFSAAQKNAAPIQSLAQLYGRVAIVQGELNTSTEEMLGFTENVAKALRVAGTDAQSASGALLQLSQAMGSGVVRAEEFNSILEGALPIAQAAAAGLEEAGGSVARLRQLVVDGKVSSEAFFRAFEAGSYVLDERLAGAEITVSQAFVRLQNVLIDVAGEMNEGSRITGVLASGLDDLGVMIQEVAAFANAAVGPVTSFLDTIGGGVGKVRDLANELARLTGLEGIGAGAATFINDLEIPGFTASSSAGGRVLTQTFDLLGATPEDEELARILAGGKPDPIEITVTADPERKTVSLADYTVTDDKKKKSAAQTKAERERQAVLDLIDALEFERSQIGRTAREQAVANALRDAGAAATEEQIAYVRQLAEAIYDETEALDRLNVSAQEWADTIEDATRGFINDLIEGKSAAEAFSNVLKNVASQLINMGLNSIFGSGGLNLAGIFGGVSTRATGGPVYAGNPTLVGEKGPEIFIPSGPGKIVPNSQVGGGATVTYAPVIDARGADMAVVARLEAQQRQLLAEFEPRVKSIVRGANHNWRVRR